jgi:hypothetical protein
LGRFVTPDWSEKPLPVPYADLRDPESLNQYTYVRNIPTLTDDPTGHDGWLDDIKSWFHKLIEPGLEGMSNNYQSPPTQHAGPGPLGINASAVLQDHMRATAIATEIVSDIASLVDPTGTGGAIRATLQGDNKGAVTALALGFIHIPGGGTVAVSEAKNLVGGWSKGTFATRAGSIGYHFDKHGGEVGAKNVWQYMRKAEGFKNHLKGATTQSLEDGAKRYEKNGKYIILNKDKKILSYGKISQ